MDLSAIRKLAETLASFTVRVGGIWQTLRARIEKWAPLGYQDATGFHVGIEEQSQD
ncbi:MAG TPA: hypothetical protein VG754_09280 [Verrucomicrobiae bacterium]|jgi:hypothetical protein|nr:hypothetical protein [Verrucomicrobiae bacterium]